jgi:hypothetical protein
VKSYLLSNLAQRYREADPRLLATDYPHSWLLWEPGAWRAPRHGHTTLIQVEPMAPSPGGEALALVLQGPRGGGQVTFGRGERCDIALNDATLSQLHLVFMEGVGGWTVRDAGSTNGSWVEGQPLSKGQPILLRPGAHLQAAQVHLTFHDAASLLARLQGVCQPVRAGR